MWIQGDLHAQNFGTYMDGAGHLVFDVNDFDEAYLGHFTWDLRRLVASLALMGWTKALSDDDIRRLCSTYLRAYLDQARDASSTTTATTSGRCAWARPRGPVERALMEAQLSTRVGLLDRVTVVEDYARRFRKAPGVRRLEDDERERVEQAFAALPRDDPGVQAPRQPHLRRQGRRRASRVSASAAPGCRRTTCSSRATPRRSRTTWS